MEERKGELMRGILEVISYSPSYDRIVEKNVRRILGKLDLEDLTYLANVFDDLADFLREKLRPPRG